MRETVRSMRAYFFVVGLFAGGYATLNLWAFLEAPASPLKTWIQIILVGGEVIGLVVAVAFLYAGLTARRYLDRGDPRRVQQIILLSGAAYIVNGLAAMSLHLYLTGWGGRIGPGLLGLAISLAITWYLYVNARRLAAESMERRTKELGETFE